MNFTIILVVIDKKRHKELYQERAFNPYHFCLQIMLERYFYFLKEQNSKGDVLAESRGNKEDRILKEEYKSCLSNGTKYIKACEFNKVLTSKEIKLKKKEANIAGLQICDILAFTLKKDFLSEKGFKLENTAFSKEISKIVEYKFYKSKNGKIEGYGKIFLPLK